MDRYILVLHRGWVLVGDLSMPKDAPTAYILEGAVIRRWGTSKGLGELADKGPLEYTVLDPIKKALIPHQQVIFMLECSEAWNSVEWN